jgi:1,4-alpha-glucan branching enzyme
MMIAEESTAWPGVTAPVDVGGLGFDFKWNMGWMHDSLHYMARDPLHRQHHHHELSFSLVYAFSEHFMLPISHDEVVHGKGSLLQKMPGDAWQKAANLRAYLGWMWGHPGKKLLFMGCELGQLTEWNHDSSVAWHLLDEPRHRGLQRLVSDLNGVYTGTPALHALDSVPDGFEWVVGNDTTNSVFALLRKAPIGGPTQGHPPVLVVSNLTPMPRHGYRIGVPAGAQAWREVINTDAAIYGGSGLGNGGQVVVDHTPSHGQACSLVLSLPPLSTLFLTPLGAAEAAWPTSQGNV